jgi:hypothetical protein
MREPVNMSQMDIKRKICDIRTWIKHLFLDISSTNIDTLVPSHRNPQHESLVTVVSATSATPFQPLRHQRNVCHPAVNRFTRQTVSIVNRKHLFMNIFCVESFCPQKKNTHNRTLLLGSILLKRGRHFDYWNQPLTTSMRLCYLDCHEAGLCCYLVQNLWKPIKSLPFLTYLLTPS